MDSAGKPDWWQVATEQNPEQVFSHTQA